VLLHRSSARNIKILITNVGFSQKQSEIIKAILSLFKNRKENSFSFQTKGKKWCE
jgi:hypothetical protein